ncbi:xaa-Pro aminopeptidase [Cryptococcus wingfieldii CBS 7118]|uniref:Xaa-Pro aminopeptidase n=1 Tax=Cryptococcus wingfieldii CBS 7118 TaxID=1295528 RepID=A0A1E3JLZ6_9TREE|nr:xaa-Pro aminopeptidase [Cryptococcus wingfieldii CBS 7118]ODO01899.1 xaa-Pro aminopeptidase [Cryptococcus wingfieldii CBS 7118]
MSDSVSKLTALRGLMKDHNIDAYIVPSEDAHSSEYLAPCDARRAFLTGFTGSAGCAIVTHDKALLWTDGRYWIQAEKQLGPGWSLMKSSAPDVPTWNDWLATTLDPTSKIGIDPTLLPFSETTTLQTSLASSSSPSSPGTKTSRLIPTPNLIDPLFTPTRPPKPSEPIFLLPTTYTGESLASKLARVRVYLDLAGSPGVVLSGLDQVAWILNLRGNDIPYNPVFFGYAVITPGEARVFLNLLVFRGNKKPQLGGPSTVTGANGEKMEKTDKMLIGTKTSWAIARALGEENVEVRRSIVDDYKAQKNATEIEGFRQSHIRDGFALVRYLAWLEEVLENGEEWTEYDAATVLENYRKENKWFMGLSFETISSTGANAAVIHYAPPEEGSAIIRKDQMYLCDSGAQYLDGTTDVTRTLHFGTPTEDQKIAFTRVLQGHISLDTVVFPEGTTGYILDILARRPLWSSHLDYRHGTSHGIGHFLNVHEGPQGIGQRIAYNDVPLKEGMVISNEPGCYKEGEWGVRIEGVDVVERRRAGGGPGEKGWLGLERITMCPIQTKLVIPALISPDEKDWLNAYHSEVYAKISPLCKEVGDERALVWLEKECRFI